MAPWKGVLPSGEPLTIVVALAFLVTFALALRTGWRSAVSEALQLVSLLAAAVLTGNELGTWAVVHPALHRLPFRDEVRAEQAITRHYGYFMPGVMLLAIVSGFAAGATLDGEARTLVFAASICFTAMLGITLIGNVPINVRTLGFGEEGEAEWRRLRRRWDHLHLGRIILDLAGLVLIALAAID